ncbi:unnamed protein product [Strongylus vulgaris]|uniref:C2H2-type domain-containing protein n=1 Tax=Strongylus vulgaris TaxID=40348 RepID=A0A3P7IGX9_STRVU|nr:unnamed protein product [Strongylus vulgaris]
MRQALGGQTQIQMWMERQIVALQAVNMYNTAMNNGLLQVPNPQLLAPPTDHLPRAPLLRQSTVDVSGTSMGAGPVKGATLWRRSRSESDVSRNFTTGPFVCATCGQAFALHDRLAKHIASRHRDRSASAIAEADGAKSHKCNAYAASYGAKAIQLSTLRTSILSIGPSQHTSAHPHRRKTLSMPVMPVCSGRTSKCLPKTIKPSRTRKFQSRRDMITRHLRTHVRPDGSPVDISVPIAQLSLTPSISSVSPNFGHTSPQPPSAGDVRQLLGAVGGSLEGKSITMSITFAMQGSERQGGISGLYEVTL